MLTQEIIAKLEYPKKVYLPTGDLTNVFYIGSSIISPRNIITNVFHVLEFKYNLMTLSKVAKELRCSIIFFHHFCIFQELYSGKVRDISK